MSTFKLTYFNITGPAEPIRYLLAYANQPFEDDRFEIEEWNNKKYEFIFEKVPILEIDGIQYNQGLSSARYLGKEYKLAGRDNKENFVLDCLTENIVELREACVLYYGANSEKREVLKNRLHNIKIPGFMDYFEELINENEGHLAFSRLTWADIHFAASIPYMTACSGKDILEDKPNCKTLFNKVQNYSGIKKFLETCKKPRF